MNKLKAIIVEDNGFMATALEDLLRQFSQSVSLAGLANSGETAIEIIREVKPDVVFLDVELQDMTGFELLRRLPDIRFKTVFTTSYSHYAIEAFQINALHYLVKPIKRHDLSKLSSDAWYRPIIRINLTLPFPISTVILAMTVS